MNDLQGGDLQGHRQEASLSVADKPPSGFFDSAKPLYKVCRTMKGMSFGSEVHVVKNGSLKSALESK